MDITGLSSSTSVSYADMALTNARSQADQIQGLQDQKEAAQLDTNSLQATASVQAAIAQSQVQSSDQLSQAVVAQSRGIYVDILA